MLKLMLGGMDGRLRFPLPSMDGLNQTEPATFAILFFRAFFRVSKFFECCRIKKEIGDLCPGPSKLV